MQNTITSQDIHTLNTGLQNVGIEISTKLTSNCPFPLAFNFITKPDGSLRWLWPAGTHTAPFLNFYHQDGLRAKSVAVVAKSIAVLGHSSLLATGKCTLYINQVCYDLLNTLNDCAIATSCPTGEKNKLVFWGINNGASFFARIPAKPTGNNGVVNLLKKGLFAKNNGVETAVIYKATTTGIHKTAYLERTPLVIPRSINDLPIAALQQWVKKGASAGPASTVLWANKIADKIAEMAASSVLGPLMVSRLRTALQVASEQNTPVLRLSNSKTNYCDIRYNNNDLFVFDWNHEAQYGPQLFDVFHMLYLLGMRNNMPYREIRKQIVRYFANPAWVAFIAENNIELVVAENEYLLQAVTCMKNEAQSNATEAQEYQNLMQIWLEAIGYRHTAYGLEPAKAVLHDVVHVLKDKTYSVLKLRDLDIADAVNMGSIDICLSNDDAEEVLDYLTQHSLVALVNKIGNKVMKRISLLLTDNTVVNLLFLHAFRHRQLAYMEVSEVLAYTTANAFGIKVPPLVRDFKYTWLSHLLSNNNIPAEYLTWFGSEQEYVNMACIFIYQYKLKQKPDELWMCTEDVRDTVVASLQESKRASQIRDIAQKYNQSPLAILVNAITCIPSRLLPLNN